MPAAFIAYEKMARSTSNWSPADFRKIEKSEWIATEKVHGSNVSFLFDCATQSIQVAKRTAILSADEDFFSIRSSGFLELQRPLVQRAVELVLALPSVKKLSGFSPSSSRVVIYGELCGGIYPIPVPNPNPLRCPSPAVQRGVHYGPSLYFFAFDIAVDSTSRYYLDFDDAIAIFQQSGLLHAKPLFRGSLQKAMAFPIVFDSLVPNQLGLPPLPPTTNRAEGIVIKPSKNAFIRGERVIIKIKAPGFEEVAAEGDKISSREFKTSGGANSSGYSATAAEDEAAGQAFAFELWPYMTSNRLDAVLSKHGILEKDISAEDAARYLAKDAIDDAVEDNADLKQQWNDMSVGQQEAAKQALIQGPCTDLINERIA